MLTATMIRILEKQRLGFAATVSPDGSPNLSPKGTFVVIDQKTIAFGEIRSPNTLRNLRENPAIEINFVDPLARKGFRVKGRAMIAARDTQLYNQHIGLFSRWGALAERIVHVVVTNVTEASMVTSPAYDDGACEDDLREQWSRILLAGD